MHIITGHSQPSGKSGRTTATVAAHSALFTVGVVIDHAEIMSGARIQQDQAVGAYTCMPVAQIPDEVGTVNEMTRAVVDENEIVAGAMVFVKMYLHAINIILH